MLKKRKFFRSDALILNRFAAIYDLVTKLIGLSKEFRIESLSISDVKQHQYILDVGCGTGDLTLLAAQKVGKKGVVVGIDASFSMISIALNKKRESSSIAFFLLGLAEELPFDDGSFDLIIFSLVLHHLSFEGKQKALREAQRLLKSGGRVIIIDFDKPSKRWSKFIHFSLWLFPKIRGNIVYGLDSLAKNAGFSLIEKRYLRWGIISSIVAAK